jgi:hypothetical protein
MALSGWQSAWLASERPALAPALLSMLRAARAQAAAVDSALPQACVALGWLARMELLRMGAPAGAIPNAESPPSVAELLKEASGASGEVRARLLERAWVAGAGAMIPQPREGDVDAGSSLLQALAWCQQGQSEALLRLDPRDLGRLRAEQLAAERNEDLRSWIAGLQRQSHAERWVSLAPLRTAAMAQLWPRTGAWLDLAARMPSGAPVP